MSSLKIFENNGGKFLVSESLLISNLSRIKAFVFDWDGVFTNGEKDQDMQTRFNEVDSMGTNLLRFTYFLKNKELPIAAIISGENNKTAFAFTTRECFNSNYFKFKNKTDATKHLCETFGITDDRRITNPLNFRPLAYNKLVRISKDFRIASIGLFLDLVRSYTT